MRRIESLPTLWRDHLKRLAITNLEPKNVITHMVETSRATRQTAIEGRVQINTIIFDINRNIDFRC